MSKKHFFAQFSKSCLWATSLAYYVANFSGLDWKFIRSVAEGHLFPFALIEWVSRAPDISTEVSSLHWGGLDKSEQRVPLSKLWFRLQVVYQLATGIKGNLQAREPYVTYNILFISSNVGIQESGKWINKYKWRTTTDGKVVASASDLSGSRKVRSGG